MTSVITESQARQITGGRRPLIPVEYESALKALEACATIDDAKYWDNKADALAAWAKIYHDDEAATAARRLKLHAYHRLGSLARELQPGGYKPNERGRIQPGPRALLVQHGLSTVNAHRAIRISRATKAELQPHIDAGRGVVNTAAIFRGRSGENRPVSSDAWLWLAHSDQPGARLRGVVSAFKKRRATDVARDLATGEFVAARKMAREIIEWLDEFEQAIPAAKCGK